MRSFYRLGNAEQLNFKFKIGVAFHSGTRPNTHIQFRTGEREREGEKERERKRERAGGFICEPF